MEELRRDRPQHERGYGEHSDRADKVHGPRRRHGEHAERRQRGQRNARRQPEAGRNARRPLPEEAVHEQREARLRDDGDSLVSRPVQLGLAHLIPALEHRLSRVARELTAARR